MVRPLKGHWGSTSHDLVAVEESALSSPQTVAIVKSESTELIMAAQNSPKSVAVGMNSTVSGVWYTQKWRWFDMECLLTKWDNELEALDQRFLQGHVSSDPLKRSNKLPEGKPDREGQLTLS